MKNVYVNEYSGYVTKQTHIMVEVMMPISGRVRIEGRGLIDRALAGLLAGRFGSGLYSYPRAV